MTNEEFRADLKRRWDELNRAAEAAIARELAAIPATVGPVVVLRTHPAADAVRAVGNLRHLYRQMLAGEVPDTAEAARGLLGPAIDALERFVADAVHGR